MATICSSQFDEGEDDQAGLMEGEAGMTPRA
jgi:hypothetical protein